MNVFSYGVHVSNSIPFLHQSIKSPGVDALGQNMASPFTLQVTLQQQRLGEPTAIDLHPGPTTARLPDDFMNNALVDLYLPKPNLESPPAIVFIKNKSMDPFPVLRRLSDLSSLDVRSTVIFDSKQVATYRDQLKLTNLGPLTLIGVSTESSFPIFDLTECARILQRNLVITGNPGIPTPKDAIDYTDAYNAAAAVLETIPRDVDLKRLGAHFFKYWMQKLYEENIKKEG